MCLPEKSPVAQNRRDVSANRLRRSRGRGTSASTSLAGTDSLLKRTEDVVTQYANRDLMNSSIVTCLDQISARSSSHFVDVNPLRSYKDSRLVYDQHCSNETSFKTARLSMNSRSSRLSICTTAGLNLLPIMLSQMFSYSSAVHSTGPSARDSNCRRIQPTDGSLLVLQTCDDCCHKLRWTSLSTSLQLHSTIFAIIGALLRRFCDAVHVHRQIHNMCFA